MATRKTTKPASHSLKLTKLPRPQADASEQIEVLWDAIHATLDQANGADGSMTAAPHFEAGAPTDETRDHIENTHRHLATAHGLAQLAMWLTFGPEMTPEQLRKLSRKIERQSKRASRGRP